MPMLPPPDSASNDDGQFQHTPASPHSQTVTGIAAASFDAEEAALSLVHQQFVWATDADGVWRSPTSDWCAYTGQTLEQASQDTALAAVHPEDRARAHALWRHASVNHQPMRTACRIRRHDGVYERFLLFATPLLTADGQISRWAGTLTNLTGYEQLQREYEVEHARHQASMEAALRAVQQVQAAEVRFQRLINTSIIGIHLADQERAIEANDAFLDYIGYTREDLRAERIRWRDITPPEYHARTAQAHAELLAHGECVPFEKEYIRKDGRRITVLMGSALLSRDPFQAVTFAVDQSERQQHKREAEEYARWLEGILEAVTEGVVVYDVEGNIIRVNEGLRKLWGLTTVPGHLDLSMAERGRLMQPRDVQGNPLPLELWPSNRVLRGETTRGSESWDVMLTTLDGREIVVGWAGAPIRDAAGRVAAAVVVGRDVTAQRRAEQQMRFQASMLERTYDAIVLWRLGGPVVFWNAGAARLYGFSAEEAMGAPSHDLLHTEYPEAREVFEAQLVREGEWQGELRHTTRDGRTLTVLSHHQVLRAEDGAQYVLAIAHDITERKRLEQEMAVRARELEEAHLQLDQFLHLVTHELRSPLTALRANVQLADQRLSQQTLPPPRSPGKAGKSRKARPSPAEGNQARPAPIGQSVRSARERLERALHQVDQLDRLIRDLTDASRAQTGKLAVNLKPCDLALVVSTAVGETRRLTSRPIRLHLPPDAVPVLADPGRVEQVLGNYLTNALKYAPGESAIDVSLTLEGGFARVAVRDQGPGLSPEAQRQVWERYGQAVPSLQAVAVAKAAMPQSANLGLGLFVSRSLIESHGGTVGVESELGAGATFWFTLPLHESASMRDVAE